MAGAGLEELAKGKRGEGRIPACAPTGDHQPPSGCHLAQLDQIARAVYAVVHIHDAPLAVEPLLVGPAIAGAATVVYIQDCDLAAGPILHPEIEDRSCGARWPTVALHQQGWLLAFWPACRSPGYGRIIEAVRCQAALGWELDGAGVDV